MKRSPSRPAPAPRPAGSWRSYAPGTETGSTSCGRRRWWWPRRTDGRRPRLLRDPRRPAQCEPGRDPAGVPEACPRLSPGSQLRSGRRRQVQGHLRGVQRAVRSGDPAPVRRLRSRFPADSRGRGSRCLAPPPSRRRRRRGRGPRRDGQEAELALTVGEAYRGGRKSVTIGGAGQRTFEVNIPPGVTDGQRIRLAGQGGRGSDGARSGDLYFIVRILPHPVYRVQGRDLHLDLRLAPWEASLGTSVPVDTPGGEANAKVPPAPSCGTRPPPRGRA